MAKVLLTESVLKEVPTTSLPINRVFEEAIKKDHLFALNELIY